MSFKSNSTCDLSVEFVVDLGVVAFELFSSFTLDLDIPSESENGLLFVVVVGIEVVVFTTKLSFKLGATLCVVVILMRLSATGMVSIGELEESFC